jgi:site-specific DNA recombinase
LAEPARIVGLLVERITITGEGIAVDLRTGGLGSIVRDMPAARATKAVA